jgi:hypothetical protein
MVEKFEQYKVYLFYADISILTYVRLKYMALKGQPKKHDIILSFLRFTT